MNEKSIAVVFDNYKEKTLEHTQIIEYLSRLSWRINKNSYDLKLLKIGEETITDLLLMELANLQEKTIVRKFNKQSEEPKNGADWEWWIKVSDKVIGFRIQAKLLTYNKNNRSPVYKGIGKTVGSTSNLQIDNLIQQAHTGREDGKLIPIYSFYNYLAENNNLDDGWTYAYAEVIKELLPEKNAKDPQFSYEEIKNYAQPMKQLLGLSHILKGCVNNYKQALKSSSIANSVEEKDFVIELPKDVSNLFGLLQEDNTISYTQLNDVVSDLKPPYSLDYVVVTELYSKD